MTSSSPKKEKHSQTINTCSSHHTCLALFSKTGNTVRFTHLHIVSLLPRELILATDIVEVEGIKEPILVEDAIERLVMDETNKSIIKAIAKTYTKKGGSKYSADFIQGKGEGQILLLHGPPGTGKTLTAGKCNPETFYGNTQNSVRISSRVYQTPPPQPHGRRSRRWTRRS